MLRAQVWMGAVAQGRRRMGQHAGGLLCLACCPSSARLQVWCTWQWCHAAPHFPPACSVVFDPRQCTPASKVALVRFEPPPVPDAGAAAGEHDAGKVAEGLIATLRAKAPQLHGVKLNVEKTGAEVRRCCLLLSAACPTKCCTPAMHCTALLSCHVAVAGCCRRLPGWRCCCKGR